jgi:hypothetical protein
MIDIWRKALRIPEFRNSAALWLCSMIILGYIIPVFFNYLQRRPGGVVLADPLLDMIPPMDLSIPIFIVIYGTLFYIFLMALRNPTVFSTYLASYSVMMAIRIVMLWLTPFDPPKGLVPLIDPISFKLYGGQVITRDLFFSGHTATSFLIFWTLTGRKERLTMLVLTVWLAVMLLIQHIHYSIDVVAAFPVSYTSYKIGKYLFRFPMKPESA